MAKIIPYKPKPFPPRSLKHRRFAALLKKTNAALQDYDIFLKSNPRCRSLIAPLMSVEALESTQSLKTVTKLQELFSKDESVPLDKIAKYTLAMKWGARALEKKPLSVKMLCTLHKKIKQGYTPKNDLGALRRRQNWIGPEGCPIEEAYFYPPSSENVRRLTSQLCRFIDRKGKEPLLDIALFISQFLTVHPFMDGNGRVVRLLVPLLLYRKKTVPFPAVFISSYFKRHRLRYILSLNATSDKMDWEEWIAFFLKGVLHAIRREMAYLKSALQGEPKIKLLKRYQK